MKAVHWLITCAIMSPKLAVPKGITDQTAHHVKDILRMFVMGEDTVPEMEHVRGKETVNVSKAILITSAKSAPRITLTPMPPRTMNLAKLRKAVWNVTDPVPHAIRLDLGVVMFVEKVTHGTKRADAPTWMNAQAWKLTRVLSQLTVVMLLVHSSASVSVWLNLLVIVGKR